MSTSPSLSEFVNFHPGLQLPAEVTAEAPLHFKLKRSEPQENAFAARSRVLARLALLAQIGELARKLNNMGRKNGMAASHMVEIYR